MKKILAIIYRFGYPLALLYWFIFRPTTEGVRCIVRHQDKVLLLRHTYGSQLLTVPGGGINKDESLAAAAQREVFEETGLVISQVTFITAIPHRKEFKRDTIHLFTAQTDTDKLALDPAEIAVAGWYYETNLPANVSRIIKPYLPNNAK